MNDKDETSSQATRIAWVWIENDEDLYNAVIDVNPGTK